MELLRKPARTLNVTVVRRRIADVAAFALLAGFLVFAAGPLFYLGMSSIKPPDRVWAWPPGIQPPYSFQNYVDLGIINPRYYPNLMNTIVLTALTVVVTMLCCFSAAYALSRYKRKWMKLPVFFMIAVRMFPPIVLIIPLYPVFVAMGLVDTYPALVLLLAAFGVSIGTLVMKTFIDDIPISFEESAVIDGCSGVQAFVRIVLPLAVPGIFSTPIFVAIPVWNEFLFVLTFAGYRVRTTPVLLAIMTGNVMGTYWGALMAGTVIHLAPVLVLVFLVQRRLIRGMALGGIKG